MWTVLVGPCAHHVAPSTEYPECPFEYFTAVTLCIVHWSLFVVELGERTDPGPNYDLLCKIQTRRRMANCCLCANNSLWNVTRSQIPLVTACSRTTASLAEKNAMTADTLLAMIVTMRLPSPRTAKKYLGENLYPRGSHG